LLTITITTKEDEKVYNLPATGRYELSQDAPKIGNRRISIIYTSESSSNVFSTFFDDYQKLNNNFDTIIIDVNNCLKVINQQDLNNVYYIIGNEIRPNNEVIETLDFLINNYEY